MRCIKFLKSGYNDCGIMSGDDNKLSSRIWFHRNGVRFVKARPVDELLVGIIGLLPLVGPLAYGL